ILRPGAGIMSGREGGLIHSLADWFRRAGQTVAAGDLRSRFSGRSTQEALALLLTDAAHAAGEGRTMILAIDQAEELFDAADQAKAKEAREFLDALLALLATPRDGVEFLLMFTIRADSYDPLAAVLAHASDVAEKGGAARSLEFIAVGSRHFSQITARPCSPLRVRPDVCHARGMRRRRCIVI